MAFVNTLLNVHINALQLVEIDIHVAIQRIYYMKISCMGEKKKKTALQDVLYHGNSKSKSVSVQNRYCFSLKSLLFLSKVTINSALRQRILPRYQTKNSNVINKNKEIYQNA